MPSFLKTTPNVFEYEGIYPSQEGFFIFFEKEISYVFS